MGQHRELVERDTLVDEWPNIACSRRLPAGAADADRLGCTNRALVL
jgi:hypothetical protein